jgi:hypothetical protein
MRVHTVRLAGPKGPRLVVRLVAGRVVLDFGDLAKAGRSMAIMDPDEADQLWRALDQAVAQSGDKP